MKINSKRGEIGGKWWSKRLLSILSSYGWSSRLERGEAIRKIWACPENEYWKWKSAGRGPGIKKFSL
jgi:hypothetical protein